MRLRGPEREPPPLPKAPIAVLWAAPLSGYCPKCGSFVGGSRWGHSLICWGSGKTPTPPGIGG